MRVLDELEREIERVAHEAGEVRRRRWWRSSLVLVLLPLSVATVAVAAQTGILSGEPVKNPPGLKLDPKAGLGVVVGEGKIFDVRAPDPAGGPPWALRYVKTSRGFGCAQVGRFVDGKLGVLGQNGAFDDDGKFHELGAEVLQSGMDCRQMDAAGNAFLALNHSAWPTSGGPGFRCHPQRASGGVPKCPRDALRNVIYGLLGPEVAAITYLDAHGRLVRQAVSGPEGGYLIVKPADAKQNGSGRISVGIVPVSGIKSIEYRDGSTCKIGNPRRLGGARKCPVKGFAAPEVERATRDDLASPVRVRVGRRGAKPPGVIPKGVRIDKQRKVVITFRARVAADGRNFYSVATTLRKGGRGCAGGMMGAIAKDITAGTVVEYPLYLPFRCRGKLEIRIGYSQPTGPTAMPFDTGGFANAKVGKVVVPLG